MTWRVTLNHKPVFEGDMAESNKRAQALRKRHQRPDSVRIVSPSGVQFELDNLGQWCEVESEN
jgi:hypothetical protein